MKLLMTWEPSRSPNCTVGRLVVVAADSIEQVQESLPGLIDRMSSSCVLSRDVAGFDQPQVIVRLDDRG